MSSNLKYLYEVKYNNGEVYLQNKNDISVVDPGRSCYHDLRLNDIVTFALYNEAERYSLDLREGSITVNGDCKFYLHTQDLTEYKLSYFKRVVMDISNEVRSLTVHFYLGYKAKNSLGEEVERHIVLK